MIKALSKWQNTIELSSYGLEMVAMQIAQDFIIELQIKLKMFGISLIGPANVYCDNKGVMSNMGMPKSTLSKKNNCIDYHVIHE